MVERHFEEWKMLSKKKTLASNEEKKCWKPPAEDFIKINIDGAFRKEEQSGGWGAIARDSAGDPIFAAAGKLNVTTEALQSELLALVNVIPIAESMGMGRVIFSTDC
jgi:ribonuclease HI